MTTPWLDTPQWSRPTCEAVNIIVAEHLNISLEKASRLVELGRDSSEICYVMAQMPVRIGVMDTCTTKLPNTSRFMLSMETNGNNLYEKRIRKVQTCLIFLRCCVVLRQLWDSGLGGFSMVMQSYTVDRSNEYDTIGMSFRPLPFFKTSIMSWLRFGLHWAGNGWELVVCVCVWVKWPSWDLFLVSYHSIWVGLKTIDPPSWPDTIRSLFGMPLGSLSNHNRSMKVL